MEYVILAGFIVLAGLIVLTRGSKGDTGDTGVPGVPGALGLPGECECKCDSSEADEGKKLATNPSHPWDPFIRVVDTE